VLFTDPIWLSLSVAALAALSLLIASLAVRDLRRRAGFNKAVWLTVGALAAVYAKAGAIFAALVAVLFAFNYSAAFAVERAVHRRERGLASAASARFPLVVSVAVNVALVAACAFGGFVRPPYGALRRAVVPFGISFFALHAVSYLIDIYRRRAFAQKNRSQIGVYLLLFPQVISGPIAYEGVSPQLARGSISLSDFSYGVRRFLIGVWKTFVIAGLIGVSADSAFAIPLGQLNASHAWLGVVCFALQVYFAFSGYSDIGIGLGRMLGFRLPENFRWPYVAETIQEFWNRWHMGLSSWAREYGDASLDPERVPPPDLARDVVMILAFALWYRARWTLLVWGIYQAALLVVERYGLSAAVKRLPILIRHVYVLTALLVGWVFFRSDTVPGALLFLKAMFGLNRSASHVPPAISPELWLLVAGGVIGSAPLVPTIRRWSVAIDALTTSVLMMLFATAVFVWQGGSALVAFVAGGGRRRFEVKR
jgi:alginate O-acetyltransferase complex protein AlgI